MNIRVLITISTLKCKKKQQKKILAFFSVAREIITDFTEAVTSTFQYPSIVLSHLKTHFCAAILLSDEILTLW